ncbi:MAG TPA: hypothetical protein VFO93_07020, partial [Hymenobacter sp.]|uniref:hypothetical protein n=1 Tax=Hymenobacter sp. TaxID=1898978 RepID=UPI002D7EE336
MSHKYTTVAALLFGTAVLPRLASAQESERLLKKELAADGQPTLIEFRAASRPSAADGAFVLRQQLGLGQDEQMRPLRRDTDELGFTHQKFEQYYQGVKIEH